jgi:ABC-type polysaccharide/polyol phosphate transport system ATPase subunit
VLPAGASSRPRATPERYPISFVSQGTASTQGKGRTRSQGGTFHGSLSGRENVAFIARVYGASVRHTTRYVEEFAELGGYFEMPVEAAP